jgi:serine protease AprX
LESDATYTGRGVTIAFLDSGFCAHPDLVEPENRIVAHEDVTDERLKLESVQGQAWQWHGTQTTVVAAGNGRLSDGIYSGLAKNAQLALVKVGVNGRITEDDIARGLEWVIANRERYNIRVLNISLGGDEDVPCSKSTIDQLAEKAVGLGIVVVVAAGNSAGSHSIPPANSPSVITVGGYSDQNQQSSNFELYHSNFGATRDGTVKPEIIAPAMFVAAPILPGTTDYERAEELSKLMWFPDYQLKDLSKARLQHLPLELANAGVDSIRAYVDSALKRDRIVAAHYQHVEGTSFAAPIVSSIVALMIEANPTLTPGAIKNILISTADRLRNAPAIRQGFGAVNAKRAIAAAIGEEHTLNVVGCQPPRVDKDKLVFVFHDDAAEHVAVAGDFNNWSTSRDVLQKESSGLWVARVPAPAAGSYQYKFIVNGHRWIEDPSNGMKTPDSFGGLNSLIVIE